MTRPSNPPVFLHKASYRQRRLRDAAKLLPFVGAILWAIPLAWNDNTDAGAIGAAGLIYVFGVWVVLIVLTAVLASRMRADVPDNDQDEPSA